jgi:hypothetical protein
VSTIYAVQECTALLYNVRCTMYHVLCTMYYTLCTMCKALCIMYNVLCMLHSVQCTMYDVTRVICNIFVYVELIFTRSRPFLQTLTMTSFISFCNIMIWGIVAHAILRAIYHYKYNLIECKRKFVIVIFDDPCAPLVLSNSRKHLELGLQCRKIMSSL